MPFKTKIKIKIFHFFIPLVSWWLSPFFILGKWNRIFVVALSCYLSCISRQLVRIYFNILLTAICVAFISIFPLEFFLAICYYPFAFQRSIFLAFYAYCFAHTKIIFYPKYKTRYGQMILTFGAANKVQQKAYSNFSVSNN